MNRKKTYKLGDKTLSGWVVASLPMTRAKAEHELEVGNYPEDLYRVEGHQGKWYIVTSPIMM